MFDLKSQQSPLEQRVSLQAQLSSHWKIKCSIEIQFFTAWADSTPYVKYQLQSVTPLHRVVEGTPIAKEHHCQISREPNISFTGAYCAFLRYWGIYIVEHNPYTRLSSGHGSDPLEGFGTPSQKTNILGEVAANPNILKTIPTFSRCGTICSTKISKQSSSTIFTLEDQMLH